MSKISRGEVSLNGGCSGLASSLILLGLKSLIRQLDLVLERLDSSQLDVKIFFQFVLLVDLLGNLIPDLLSD